MRHAAWTTLTEARLRLAQGDVEGARRVLGEIAARADGSPEARAAATLCRGIAGRRALPRIDEAPEPEGELPQGTTIGAERALFRRAPGRATDRQRKAACLRRWLGRLERAARTTCSAGSADATLARPAAGELVEEGAVWTPRRSASSSS